MGYIPPRPQRPDETTAEYIAYLEALLVSRRRAQAFSLLLGLAIALIIIVTGAIR